MRVPPARLVALVAAALCLSVGGAAPVRAAPETVTITPATLPSATIGAPYRQYITTSGPNPPYTVQVTQGALPSGLFLSPDGALTGQPASVGRFAFTVAAYAADGTYVAFRDYMTRVSPAAPRTGRAYFADDFENGLGKWNLEGHASAFTLIRGRTGQGASITVGPSTTGPTSSKSELASLWLNWPAAYADGGKDTWYAARVKFPVGYQATTGQWNWFIAWHNDDATGHYPGAYSPALGVYTDYPFTSKPGRNPRLAFRVMGGSVTSPRQFAATLPANSLKHGLWYDIVIHFIWSVDPRKGLAEFWLDGELIVSRRFPTLFGHPDGATSYHGFGLYNYRPKSAWDSSIYFDRIRIGPTRASVAGQRRK